MRKYVSCFDLYLWKILNIWFQFPILEIEQSRQCYSLLFRHLWGIDHASRTVLSTAEAKGMGTGSCPPFASHLIQDSQDLIEPQAVSKVPTYAWLLQAPYKEMVMRDGLWSIKGSAQAYILEAQLCRFQKALSGMLLNLWEPWCPDLFHWTVRSKLVKSETQPTLCVLAKCAFLSNIEGLTMPSPLFRLF